MLNEIQLRDNRFNFLTGSPLRAITLEPGSETPLLFPWHPSEPPKSLQYLGLCGSRVRVRGLRLEPLLYTLTDIILSDNISPDLQHTTFCLLSVAIAKSPSTTVRDFWLWLRHDPSSLLQKRRKRYNSENLQSPNRKISCSRGRKHAGDPEFTNAGMDSTSERSPKSTLDGIVPTQDRADVQSMENDKDRVRGRSIKGPRGQWLPHLLHCVRHHGKDGARSGRNSNRTCSDNRARAWLQQSNAPGCNLRPRKRVRP